MLKLIAKYSFAFLSAGFGLCGIFALAHLYVEDKLGFSSLINDLGSFGSFLSGLGTIVAAAAAAIGVDSWVKQLKYGKYLDIIWAAKVAIRKVHVSETDWYISNYSYLEQPSESGSLDLEAKLKRLKYDFDDLTDKFHHLDQVVVKNQFLWACNGAHHKHLWLKIMLDMEENGLSSKDLPQLSFAFRTNYESLMAKLDEIEEKYSK